jgi:hypothetical protein
MLRPGEGILKGNALLGSGAVSDHVLCFRCDFCGASLRAWRSKAPNRKVRKGVAKDAKKTNLHHSPLRSSKAPKEVSV